MIRISIGSLLFGLALLVVSCRSTDTRWLEERPEPPAQDEQTTFVTQTDTVTALGAEQAAAPSTPHGSIPVRFTVQIGSYRNSRYASEVQILARERFSLPVVNDYNTTRRLYQIRIGFFETDKHAAEFLTRLRTEYPYDYKDAWIVQIGK
ncbi:MAG: SPOR domain-containing protein [Bacteroidetes bacterium]|nr:SPOR domain-containing protein [Bacteroidota bacterium]MCW5894103.1 SPOR domain-containing protein [Bacteroidota bacterium]